VPWQFRKRVKLGPGIHLNIGKKSVSLSVGGRYARTSLSTTGHRTQTYALPGTGLYHRERTRVVGGAIAPPSAGERRSPAESSYAAGLEAYARGRLRRRLSGLRGSFGYHERSGGRVEHHQKTRYSGFGSYRVIRCPSGVADAKSTFPLSLSVNVRP
jgi:hypothetical protein